MDACARDRLENRKRHCVSQQQFCMPDLGNQEIHEEKKNEDRRAAEEWGRKRTISAYLDIKIRLALHIVIIDNNAAR